MTLSNIRIYPLLRGPIKIPFGGPGVYLTQTKYIKKSEQQLLIQFNDIICVEQILSSI